MVDDIDDRSVGDYVLVLHRDLNSSQVMCYGMDQSILQELVLMVSNHKRLEVRKAPDLVLDASAHAVALVQRVLCKLVALAIVVMPMAESEQVKGTCLKGDIENC